MKTARKVKRSELWNKIYDKVKELPRAKVEGDAVDHPSLTTTLEELFKSEFAELRKRQKICDELREIKLTPSLREEFDNISKNQPVFAGKLLSHQGADELYKLGLVFRYEGDYVLTEKGTVLKENLKCAFDMMCNGVFYKPQGCKLEQNFKEQGCGKCGKGSNETCDGLV